jgi:hypothetical protein
MSEWLKWSQTRLLFTLGISYILFAEAMSLLLSDGATCIVNPAKYGAYYAEKNECPALHVFFVETATTIFEKLGDPNWVIAVSAVVTAIFTVVLGTFTISLARSTRIAATAAEKALTEIERPWLFLEGTTIRRREMNDGPRVPNFWFIKLHWKNIGRAPAVIEECLFRILPKSTMSDAPVYLRGNELLCKATAAVGEEFETNEVGPGAHIEEQLVFFGRMTYTELNGKSHETAFALEVSPIIPASVPHGNKNYFYYT